MDPPFPLSQISCLSYSPADTVPCNSLYHSYTSNNDIIASSEDSEERNGNNNSRENSKRTIIGLFTDAAFICRNDALKYIEVCVSGNKALVAASKRGPRAINVRCAINDCIFKVLCRKKREKGIFLIDEEQSCFEHSIYDPLLNTMVICPGMKSQLSTVITIVIVYNDY